MKTLIALNPPLILGTRVVVHAVRIVTIDNIKDSKPRDYCYFVDDKDVLVVFCHEGQSRNFMDIYTIKFRNNTITVSSENTIVKIIKI
jgi:hypothetical protein